MDDWEENLMDIMKYLNKFLIDSYWENKNVPEQARALFTSWYLMENIDADKEKMQFCTFGTL